MKRILFIFSMIGILQGVIFAQVKHDNYDLLTERFIDRPLTLHKGQFQLDAQYGFSRTINEYDNSGNTKSLHKEGTAYSDYLISTQLKYGLFEIVELIAGTGYLSGVRRKSNYTVIGTNEITYYSEINENRGFKDIFAAISIRPLPKSFPLECSIENRFLFPSASFNPEIPQHTAEKVESEFDAKDVTYHFIERNGNGVPFHSIDLKLKLRFQKIALYSSSGYQYPLKEGEKKEWISQLVNLHFEYTGLYYAYKPGVVLWTDLSCHYQLFPWFDLFGKMQYSETSGGWSYKALQKKKEPVEEIFSGDFGYEVQASPLLRIYQSAAFTFAGRNTGGYYQITTGVSFSLFPFHK